MALDSQLVCISIARSARRAVHRLELSVQAGQFKQRNAASPADVPTQTFGKNKEKSA